MNLELVRTYLNSRLQLPLPGHRVQMLMEPAMSYGRHRGPAPGSARRAAVMLLMHVTPSGISVPMVQRRGDLAFHAGEIAFPGGGVEAGESWEEAAVRECWEETGITASELELCGLLTPMYVFGSSNLVMPVLALGSRPENYIVDANEVERVVDVPLNRIRPETADTTQRCLAGVSRQVPCFRVERAEIWGASAMILAELSALMSDFSR